MNALSMPQAAYLAGLLDGEGSIILARPRGKASRGSALILRVMIYNNYKPVIDWCKSLLGTGSIIVHKSRKEKWHDNYQFVLSSRQADEFLCAVLPYLRIKKEKAMEVIKYRRIG